MDQKASILLTDKANGQTYSTPRLTVWFFLAVLILSSLACDQVYNLNCLISGGKFSFDDDGDPHCDGGSVFYRGEDYASEIAMSQGDIADEDIRRLYLVACLPDLDDHILEIVDLKQETGSNKRACNARGTITNLSDQSLMYAAYRVNHYGDEDSYGEGWTTTNYHSFKFLIEPLDKYFLTRSLSQEKRQNMDTSSTA